MGELEEDLVKELEEELSKNPGKDPCDWLMYLIYLVFWPLQHTIAMGYFMWSIDVPKLINHTAYQSYVGEGDDMNKKSLKLKKMVIILQFLILTFNIKSQERIKWINILLYPILFKICLLSISSLWHIVPIKLIFGTLGLEGENSS